MFIIEGGDSLGKTTLAQKIVARANARHEFSPITYGHMSRPDLKTFDFCFDYIKMINPLSVQDRFHLGGMVYHNEVIEHGVRKDYFPDDKRQFVEGALRMNGVFILLLTTYNDEWYENKLKEENRDQMYNVSDMMEYAGKFANLITHPNIWIDDVKYINGSDEYADDAEIDNWIDQWFKRLRLAMCYKEHQKTEQFYHERKPL